MPLGIELQKDISRFEKFTHKMSTVNSPKKYPYFTIGKYQKNFGNAQIVNQTNSL